MFDIVIIGAGVVGGLIAEALSKYDKRVCIVDKSSDVAMGATRANSAIVHAGFDAKEGSLKAKFNVRGSALMEGVCKRLGVKHVNNEALVVGFENERAELEALYERGIKNGVHGLRLIEKEEMLSLEPNLNPALSCALLATTSSIVCPYELCLASIGNAMDNGVTLELDFEVTAIDKTDKVYTVRASDGRELEARYVINSAGVFADEIAKLTGDGDFTIKARRGEYILLDKDAGNFTTRTIFHTPTKMGKGVLVSPTVDGNLIVGPTSVDIDDKDDLATTAEGFATLFAKAADNVSNIPFNKVITSFSGLRASGNTGDFIIKERDGVITLGGIESPGLSASPAIAEHVEEMLKTLGALSNVKKNYKSERRPAHYFRELSVDKKNEIIKKSPAYGRIICRCEGITEGEIIEALTVNPPARDLDGVKRRTRSGMGRCQGGFCSPTIVELIAKTRGIPFESVTKFGKGSIINFGKTKGDN